MPNCSSDVLAAQEQLALAQEVGWVLLLANAFWDQPRASAPRGASQYLTFKTRNARKLQWQRFHSGPERSTISPAAKIWKESTRVASRLLDVYL